MSQDRGLPCIISCQFPVQFDKFFTYLLSIEIFGYVLFNTRSLIFLYGCSKKDKVLSS